MTTNVKVNTNGSYVAEVKIDGTDLGSVGPGSMVEKSWYLPHGSKHVVEIEERNATAEEIEASKAASAA